MRFTRGRRRPPPAIIIVSLIDILIVLLIFMMVSTTFKQRSALKLTLPESSLAKPGAGGQDGIVLSVSTNPPFFFFGERSVSSEELARLLQAEARGKPDISVTINADQGASLGNVLAAFDAAKSAKLDRVNLSSRRPGGGR